MISILASEGELPPGTRVWGRENRVLPAGEREAIGWLSLARLLGWEAEVRYERLGDCGPEAGCAVVARDPASLGAEEVAGLRARLDREPLLLIAPAAAPGAPLAELAGAHATGARRIAEPLRWQGPGPAREWAAWPEVAVKTLEAPSPKVSDPLSQAGLDSESWATIGEAPLVVARRVGNGVVATLAAHPVELADAAPSGAGLLKWLITRATPEPAAWIELDGCLVVRMDDPGSASSVHLDGWAHRSLTAEEWRAIAGELAAREARMTIGYVPGWVDDGDTARGELAVAGEAVERAAGRVHPSPLVTYAPRAGEARQDNPAGLRGIEELRRAGVGEVELHGYTHVRPPLEEWARAGDRHSAGDWYRELEELEPRPGDPGPVARGLALFERHLGARPVALCCPGHACSPAAAESAAELGLELVAAESLAVRDAERLVWCDQVRNPYLDGAAGPWLESGGPVIACLHDRDLVLEGTVWLAERLDDWAARGAERICDLRELAAMLDHRVAIKPGSAEPAVARATPGSPPLPRELPIAVRTAGGGLTTRSV